MKILIAYYSAAGSNYVGGSLKTLSMGNTEIVAQMIQKKVGGDLFQIEGKIPYSSDYQTCLDESRRDIENGAKPALKELPKDLDSYDVIYLGYPVYWGTYPSFVSTFISLSSFEGKTVIPFATSESTGAGHSVSDLKTALPKAVVKAGFSIYGSQAKQSEARVKAGILANK